ncbi:PepSY domain-containing protein [Corynebacterium sp.]|uniref:PepSY-associated TM helix domain-containing protein n=1 Tax=Corynebacterium sp. TaxID=1720 RepID=UPI0028A59B00|nr:PepSY domain-containing protein [Corynebacterium sp.]
MNISAPTRTSARRSGGAYGVIHRLHSVAGVFVAPLLVISALSGFLYAFAPSLENIVYRDVITASSTEPAQPLEEQVEAAQAVHPDLQLSAVQSFEDSTKTTRVLFNDPALESSSYRQAVFVDPGSLEITGDLVQYGSSRALPLRTWISEGHRHLWLGEPGRIYSEVAASWLGILALAGAWLWWVRRRSGKGQATSGSDSHSKRKQTRSLHSVLGIWLLPGFLFLTVTGLTWSSMAGGNIANLRAELDWIQPSPNTAISGTATDHSEHDEHAHHHGGSSASDAGELSSQDDLAHIDTVANTARAAELGGIIEIALPAEEGAAWTVTEMRESWKLSNDAISVDGETGEIVDRVDHADWPLAAKLSAWLIQLHMGTLFGWINQLVLGAIALGLLAIIIFGYRMWWLRGRNGRPGRLQAAGQWRRTRPGVLVGIIVFLLAYTAMAPMFGISLVVFLVIDAVIQALRRRT